MCSGGRTVVQQQPSPQIANQKPKPIIYMRNQWLDGLGINAEERGRNSLRIDRGSPTPNAPVRTGGPTPPSKVVVKPNIGIGGGFGGGGLGIGGGGFKNKNGVGLGKFI